MWGVRVWQFSRPFYRDLSLIHADLSVITSIGEVWLIFLSFPLFYIQKMLFHITLSWFFPRLQNFKLGVKIRMTILDLIVLNLPRRFGTLHSFRNFPSWFKNFVPDFNKKPFALLSSFFPLQLKWCQWVRESIFSHDSCTLVTHLSILRFNKQLDQQYSIIPGSVKTRPWENSSKLHNIRKNLAQLQNMHRQLVPKILLKELFSKIFPNILN